MNAESSEASTFKRQFAFLSSTIGPELRAVATELYSRSMISVSTREKAYGGKVEGFLVDIECIIKTDPAYFHVFVTVLDTNESLRGLASHLAADHRRLSTPTTTAEKVAVHRSGFDLCERSVEVRVPTCVQDMIASCSAPAGLVDSGSETERSGLFSSNQERAEQECSPQPESAPVAETSGHCPSSTQLASGLHDRLRCVEDYVTSFYVGRPELESRAKQVEELCLRLNEMKIELREKNIEISNLQTEIKEVKDDNSYLVRQCRTLETERNKLSCKVDDLEEQAKEQASILARARAASIIQQPWMGSKSKPHGRCKSWPVTR